MAEEDVWAESLRSLLKNTFDTFIPPPLTMMATTMATATSRSSEKTIKKKEVVVAAIETPEMERKAKMFNSNFLDVIWGAKTSVRSAFTIKEMIKAFQVHLTKEE